MAIDLKQEAKTALQTPLKTSKEYATRLLKDGAFAMKEKRSNPELYKAGREDQVTLKLRDDNIHDRLQAQRRAWDSPREFSQAELSARAKFSEQEVSAWYNAQHDGTHDLQKLKQDNPAEYQSLRLAASSYGLIPATPAEIGQQPVTADAGELKQVPAEMATALRIPLDTKLTEAGMSKAIQAFAEHKAAEIVAAEKAAAERVAEGAK
jgi:hypothetical protein